jgi:hypothetical protein
MYDQKRWRSFDKKSVEKYFGSKVYNSKGLLVPFYEERPVPATLLDETSAKRLEFILRARLKDAVTSHRSYLNKGDTVWRDQFKFQAAQHQGRVRPSATSYLSRRLQLEERLGHNVRCPYLVAMDENYEKDRLLTREKIKEWRAEIRKNDLDGDKWKYQEVLLHFKHSDANRITDAVITQIEPLLMMDTHTQQPEYAIAVKFERLNSHITPVRVLFCVTFKMREPFRNPRENKQSSQTQITRPTSSAGSPRGVSSSPMLLRTGFRPNSTR